MPCEWVWSVGVVYCNRRAAKCYQKAVTIKPDMTEGAMELAHILTALGDQVRRRGHLISSGCG